MSASSIYLANNERMATEVISENATSKHLQRVIVEEARSASIMGVTAGLQLAGQGLANFSGPAVPGDATSLLVAGAAGAGQGVFRYVVPGGYDLLVSEVVLFALASPSDGSAFLGSPGALPNGVSALLLDATSTTLLNLFAGVAGALTYKRDLDALLAGWTFEQPLPGVTTVRWQAPQGLPYLAAGQRIEVRVADDLSLATGNKPQLRELRAAVRGRLMTAAA